MQHLVDCVRAAIQARNWYAAISVALSLPDICGRIDDPSAGSQKRYVAWFNQHLGPTYRRRVAGQEHTFLTGEDCYALRCAYLHEGDFDIANQRARQILTAYVFVAAPAGMVIHMNQLNNRLQLQVDLFCEEICKAVEAWIGNSQGNPDIQARIAAMPSIVVWGPGARI